MVPSGEKLRERLDSLEALAASAVQIPAGEATFVAGTASKETTTPSSTSLSTAAQTPPQSLPVLDSSDATFPSSSAATSAEQQHLFPQLDGHLSDFSTWDSTRVVNPSLLTFNTSNDAIAVGPHSSGEVAVHGSQPSAVALNPYANNLRVEAICFTAALYTLGMHVGITEEMICADQSLSPFFWPSAESADDMAKASLMCTVRTTFKTIKPDLRPIAEQVTVSHHPYIDVLPFPTLRKNLIANQAQVDEDGFFHDMLSGLVCWGGAGVGKRDRDESTGYASTGTPWDVRSWEAEIWFLKKYWTLLGGEDGELVRQTEWWRSIRGDETMDVHA